METFYPGFHRRHVFISTPVYKENNPWNNAFYSPQFDFIALSPLAYASELGHALGYRLNLDYDNHEFQDRIQSLIGRLNNPETIEFAIESVEYTREFAKGMLIEEKYRNFFTETLRGYVNPARYRDLMGIIDKGNMEEIWHVLTPAEQYNIGKLLLRKRIQVDEKHLERLQFLAAQSRGIVGRDIGDVIGIVALSTSDALTYRDVTLRGHDVFESTDDDHIMAEVVSQDVAVHLAHLAAEMDLGKEILPFLIARFMEWFLSNLSQQGINNWKPAVEMILSVDKKMVEEWVADGEREGLVARGLRARMNFADVLNLAEATGKGLFKTLGAPGFFMKVFGLPEWGAEGLGRLTRLPRLFVRRAVSMNGLGERVLSFVGYHIASRKIRDYMDDEMDETTREILLVELWLDEARKERAPPLWLFAYAYKTFIFQNETDDFRQAFGRIIEMGLEDRWPATPESKVAFLDQIIQLYEISEPQLEALFGFFDIAEELASLKPGAREEEVREALYSARRKSKKSGRPPKASSTHLPTTARGREVMSAEGVKLTGR
ncbi:MAG TPA: hypothetical protein VJC03_07850, partial [bacterium]|nr:hypothetical protein [bacterium]